MALHEIWPDAPLYTSVYDAKSAPWACDFKIITSFLQKFPLARRNHELFPYLMPIAFESFNFDEYDVVVSVTSEAAKGIITKPKTLHICYCLTPTRYLWSGYENYFNGIKGVLGKGLVNYLRSWDLIAAQRVDCYLSISNTVRERIKKYYKRESEVLSPPVDIDKFRVQSCLSKNKGSSTNCVNDKVEDDYFLVVSRLVRYKKTDLVVEAFNRMGKNLKIAGVGREFNKLKIRAGKNIQFLGQLTDEDLLFYYQNCRAVIFPQEEDFGIVPLEAQACGKPVIAYRAGGARETVIEGKTGLFFNKQKVEDIIEAVGKFERIRGQFKIEDCRNQAERFAKERFKKKFKELVEKKWKNFQL